MEGKKINILGHTSLCSSSERCMKNIVTIWKHTGSSLQTHHDLQGVAPWLDIHLPAIKMSSHGTRGQSRKLLW